MAAQEADLKELRCPTPPRREGKAHFKPVPAPDDTPPGTKPKCRWVESEYLVATETGEVKPLQITIPFVDDKHVDWCIKIAKEKTGSFNEVGVAKALRRLSWVVKYAIDKDFEAVRAEAFAAGRNFGYSQGYGDALARHGIHEPTIDEIWDDFQATLGAQWPSAESVLEAFSDFAAEAE